MSAGPWIILSCLPLALLVACSSGSSAGHTTSTGGNTPGTGGSTTPSCVPTGGSPCSVPSANSFTEVYARTIQPTCSNDFCHYNGVGVSHSALDLSSHVRAYASIVGLPCQGLNCQNTGMRVIPGDPEGSVMYQKVSETSTSPSDPHPCGSPMPADITTFRTTGATIFLGNALPADQQQRIHDWIQEGAQNN